MVVLCSCSSFDVRAALEELGFDPSQGRAPTRWKPSPRCFPVERERESKGDGGEGGVGRAKRRALFQGPRARVRVVGRCGDRAAQDRASPASRRLADRRATARGDSFLDIGLDSIDLERLRRRPLGAAVICCGPRTAALRLSFVRLS